MIRIVPPHPNFGPPDDYIEKATAMAAGAQMTYRGGPLLSAVELIAVYLGDWGPTAPSSDLTKFCKAIVEGSYLDALVEYGVGRGKFIGEFFLPWSAPLYPPPPPPQPPPVPKAGCLPMLGLLSFFVPKLVTLPDRVIGETPYTAGMHDRYATGGVVGPTGAPTKVIVHAGEQYSRIFPGLTYAQMSIDDSEIQTRLKAAIADGTVPNRKDALYMIFVSPGTTVTLGTDASCTAFCGYHDATPDGIYYGVIPYPSCGGCLGPLTVFDAMTSVTSHELAEAVTDPVPGSGWYNDQSGEIGDPCAWSNRVLDGCMVQLEWMNSKSGCA